MIETPAPLMPAHDGRRRPGLGKSVVRGIILLARQYKAYKWSGYIPLHNLSPKERRDVKAAATYLDRLAGWKLAKNKKVDEDA